MVHVEQSAAGRVGTIDEIAAVAALLLGRDGAFIAAIHAGRIQLTLQA